MGHDASILYVFDNLSACMMNMYVKKNVNLIYIVNPFSNNFRSHPALYLFFQMSWGAFFTSFFFHKT